MANIYVDSNAAGTADGVTKVNAYPNIRTAGVASLAGDIIKASYLHDASIGGNYNWEHNNSTRAHPLIVESTDFSDDSPRIGAKELSASGNYMNFKGRDIEYRGIELSVDNFKCLFTWQGQNVVFRGLYFK